MTNDVDPLKRGGHHQDEVARNTSPGLSARHSFVGLMIFVRPPSRFTRVAQSDVPPGPSPDGFSSHTSSP